MLNYDKKFQTQFILIQKLFTVEPQSFYSDPEYPCLRPGVDQHRRDSDGGTEDGDIHVNHALNWSAYTLTLTAVSFKILDPFASGTFAQRDIALKPWLN